METSTVPLHSRIEPIHESIGMLFGNTSSLFRVPNYQRTYAWGETHVADFLGDIGKCYRARQSSGDGDPKGHFFGGIVCVARRMWGAGKYEFDLVDGQQRLSTFVILAACMIKQYRSLAATARAAQDQASAELAEVAVKNLTEKYLNYSARVGNNVKTLNRLELSSRDNQFFLTMVNGLATNPTSASHERIAAAFQAIGGWVDETVENEKTLDEKLTALSRMEDVINDDCTVIFIKTESQNDAYQLFQVLNDRGVNLTEGDLLRACTLQMLEGYEDLQKVAESAWDSILTDGPERTTQFLRWYFQSKTGHAASKSQLYDDLLEGLFPQNKHVAITPDDAQAIAEQVLNLKKEVVLCRKLYEAEWPYLELSEGVWARDRLNLLITQLEHTHCMPLLLAATRLSQQKFAAVVHLIERFFFRYKVICNAHISPLSRVYMQQATVIRTSPETYTLDNLVAQLNSLVPRATDELFKTALDSLIYRMDQSNKIIKYYLMTLEQYFAWYNNGASGSPTPEIVKVWDFPKTTIEHVYPQHATDVVAELEPHIHRFGNLTIMGPSENNDLGSVGFGEKRPKLAQSTVHMNREIAQASAWDLAAIVAREQKMKEVALKVFAPW